MEGVNSSYRALGVAWGELWGLPQVSPLLVDAPYIAE